MRRIEKRPEPSHFKKWKRKFKDEYGREPIYDDLIHTEEYGRLRKDLLEEQGYICCYCEQRIGGKGTGDCDIEHFMPRHPDKNSLSPKECEICSKAQLDYSNLLVSCKGEEAYSTDHCNHNYRKKDHLGKYAEFCSMITYCLEHY